MPDIKMNDIKMNKATHQSDIAKWASLTKRLHDWKTYFTWMDYRMLYPLNKTSSNWYHARDPLKIELCIRLEKQNRLVALREESLNLICDAMKKGTITEEFRQARDAFVKEYEWKKEEHTRITKTLNDKIEAQVNKTWVDHSGELQKQNAAEKRRELRWQRKVELRDRKIRHNKRMRTAAKFKVHTDGAPSAPVGAMNMAFRPMTTVQQRPLPQPQSNTFSMALRPKIEAQQRAPPLATG